ncbi:MAG: helix-turn-helix domain-containing protein [Rhizomicrobium sp.]
MGGFSHICDGQECWHRGARIPRHRHAKAYAAIVLAGSYEECGSRGRFRVVPGEVLLHDAFDAHLNSFDRAGARILNLTVRSTAGLSHGRVADPDMIARAAERDAVEAGVALQGQIRSVDRAAFDWQDELARDLIADPDRRLDDWAHGHGLAAETVSRGFRKVFGVTPAAFRLEARTRRALDMIVADVAPLAAVAAKAGFADQAHMSRAILGLTGASPGRWRRSNPFKTDGRQAA